MVEYTVETLVRLYDSLNGQIEKALAALREYNNVSLDPHLAEEYKESLELEHKSVRARLDKLVQMRNNVEELLDKILKIEVTENERSNESNRR